MGAESTADSLQDSPVAVSSEASLSAKEKFDACMSLADYFLRLWDARRGYEWKVAFGLWTLLGAGTVTLRGKHGINEYVAAIPVLVFEIFWLWPLWNRANDEKRMGAHYREQTEAILANPEHLIQRPTSKKSLFRRIWSFICDWSMLFQLITTGFFAWALFHFNNMPPDVVPPKCLP